MTQSERFDYILKLEADNREQKLKHDLATAKHNIKQQTLHAGINVITSQLSIMNAAAFLGVKADRGPE